MRAEVVAEVVRSGHVEGHHHGSVAALGFDGALAWGVGDTESQMFPRSCNKPIQALGMLRAGLDLDGELLALACASHSGEGFHVQGVRAILAGAGLEESTLQTPPDLPVGDHVREDALRSGVEASPVLMNCSGKHAAMLATCVVNGWDTASYLSPEHPLQVAIRETFEDLTGEKVEKVAVDGCGAPLLSTSLVGLARAFRALAVAEEGGLEHRVAQAIRQHPSYLSGTGRDEAELIRAVPGLIAKAGAEGCYAAAVADGRAVALKIDDGSARPRPVVMVEAMRRLGAAELPGVDAEALARVGERPVLGGGRPVGDVRAAF